MKYKNVIFTDLDGTILDTVDRHYNCYYDIIIRKNAVPLCKEEYWQLKRKKIKRTVLLEKSGWNLPYEDFYNDWLDLIETENYLEFDRLSEETKSNLFKIKKNYRIILVTMRRFKTNLINQLIKLKILDVFEDVIVTDPFVQGSKYIKLLETDIEFDKAIVIGDTEEDMYLAKGLLLPFVAITSGLRDEVYLNTEHKFKKFPSIDIIDKVFNEEYQQKASIKNYLRGL